MENIGFVFFDIGYTLVDETLVWEQRCKEQAQTEEAKRLGLTPQSIYEEIVQATISYRPQYRTVVKKYGFTEVAPYRHELERVYCNTGKVLESLYEKYRLGVIANQTAGLEDRLTEWGIRKYFSLVISSWDYQMMKPDTRLFTEAVKQSDCRVTETVMVGDRLDNDIFPAKQIGMKTIWIKQGFGAMQEPLNEEYRADNEIHNLDELLYIL